MLVIDRPKQEFFARLNMGIVLAVSCARLLLLGRLSDSALVRQVPDDAFYYLQAARNFARLGRWTFDGVEPSSGFHLLWGYLLAFFYRLFPTASLHEVFITGSLLHSFCLSVAAYLVTRTAQRLAGNAAWAGVLLVFVSAASLLQATWMMETSFVILSMATVVFLLGRLDLGPSPFTLALCFLVGIMVSLSRSDAGLLAFWLLIAHLYLWRRGVSPWGMLLAALLVLCGASFGVLAIMVHTHWISGEWLQASAQQKLFWTKVAGPSAAPAVHIFYSFFNPLTNSFVSFVSSVWSKGLPRAIGLVVRVILLSIVGVGLWLRLRGKKERSPELPIVVMAMLSAVASYCIFYRYDSASVQGWYVGNFEVPAALLAGIGLAWFYEHYQATTLTLVAGMAVSGILCSMRASFPWQEAMWRTGVYLKSHHELRPLGTWNTGIIGYFADNGEAGEGITNMDGLMNDAILPYAQRGDLSKYFIQRHLRYIFESPQIWEPTMSRRGGYGNGKLRRCVVESQDLFPSDPDNLYGNAHIQLYTLDLDCLSRSDQAR